MRSRTFQNIKPLLGKEVKFCGPWHPCDSGVLAKSSIRSPVQRHKFSINHNPSAERLGSANNTPSPLHPVNHFNYNCLQSLFFEHLDSTLSCLFSPVYLPGSVYIVVRHKTIIIPIHQRRRDHKICSSAIAGNGYVPNNRHPQKRLDIWVMRLRFKRIPEKNQKIDFTISYLGTDLLIPPQWATLKFVDSKAKLFVPISRRLYLLHIYCGGLEALD